MELARTDVRAVAVAAPEWEAEGSGVPGVPGAARRRGALVLPDKRRGRAVGSVTRVPRTAAGEPGRALLGNVRDVEPLQVELVREPAQRLLFRELVGTLPLPSGTRSRSAPTCAIWCLRRGRRGRWSAACSSPAPAWRMAARDRWIGWDERTRARNLQRGVNNSRFLLLPWVAMSNLASAVLARGLGAVGGGLAAPLPPRAVAGGDAGGPSPPPRGLLPRRQLGRGWAPRAVAVAWTGTAAVPGRRPRRSWFILWSEMRSGGCGSVERCEPSPPAPLLPIRHRMRRRRPPSLRPKPTSVRGKPGG